MTIVLQSTARSGRVLAPTASPADRRRSDVSKTKLTRFHALSVKSPPPKRAKQGAPGRESRHGRSATQSARQERRARDPARGRLHESSHLRQTFQAGPGQESRLSKACNARQPYNLRPRFFVRLRSAPPCLESRSRGRRCPLNRGTLVPVGPRSRGRVPPPVNLIRLAGSPHKDGAPPDVFRWRLDRVSICSHST